MANIKIDTKEVSRGLQEYYQRVFQEKKKSTMSVALEILRLSQFQVPHDTGLLQNSGTTQPEDDGSTVVGYNKVYAARLHEHPEYRFQKGRKGKYLEDPIKQNLSVFKRFMQDALKITR